MKGNFRIAVFFCLTAGVYGQGGDVERILVDQLGFRPADQKIAFIRGVPGEKFEVVEDITSRVVLTGKFQQTGSDDAATGDVLYTIDFSRLKTPGHYSLRINGRTAASDVFAIGESVYDKAALTALKSFYYQRCGTEIGNGSRWHHDICHTNDAALFENPDLSKDVSGGWHDAGDYGKFVPTGTVSAAFLLYLYELQPWKFTDGQLAIPESKNGVPDILDEVRWELRWLLKMQREDGGVFHKVSAKGWTGEYLPQYDPDRRYIFDVASTSTADLAAVTALAARIYEKWDRAFAQDLLRSAVRAWKFLEANPTSVPAGGFHNPYGVDGGEYGDDQDIDERLWASTELYRTTGNIAYHKYFLAHYAFLGGPNYPVGWQLVKNFAYYSYLSMPAKATDETARLYITTILSYNCDYLMQRIREHGYRFVLNPDQYYWGSVSVALGYAFDLIWGYELIHTPRYLEGALDQIHYILGRNPFNQTFVTGVGNNPVKHPYHQFSMMLHAGAPVPGLVVGGPNNNSRLRGKVISEYPGKCYEDNEKNFFVNETAINYTAPFVFVSGYFSVLGKQLPDREEIGKR